MNNNRIVSITICRCNHEDVVIIAQASFIDPEGKLTNVVHVIFIFKIGYVLEHPLVIFLETVLMQNS